jgi:hypothetical protein
VSYTHIYFASTVTRASAIRVILGSHSPIERDSETGMLLGRVGNFRAPRKGGEKQ